MQGSRPPEAADLDLVEWDAVPTPPGSRAPPHRIGRRRGLPQWEVEGEGKLVSHAWCPTRESGAVDSGPCSEQGATQRSSGHTVLLFSSSPTLDRQAFQKPSMFVRGNLAASPEYTQRRIQMVALSSNFRFHGSNRCQDTDMFPGP